MYLCMCVYMYGTCHNVCIHACMHVCMYVCIHVCMYVYMYVGPIGMYSYLGMHRYIILPYVHACTCVCMCITCM